VLVFAQTNHTLALPMLSPKSPQATVAYPSSFFIRLLEATDTSRKQLEAVPRMDRMIHQGFKRDEYLLFLEDLYHIVWHFCPAMGSAASRLDDRYRQVRYCLYDKIAEEKGHEEWVLNDIGHIGGDVDRVRNSKPRIPVEAFIAYNYYVTERLHPVAVLGMLYTLEVLASVYASRVASSAQDAMGVKGPEGFTFLESHSTMDADHLAELKVVIKSIEEPALQDALIRSTLTNFWLFARVIE
jgi:pyrroloquinoline quinone (PQQ) biosynthesis protein C